MTSFVTAADGVRIAYEVVGRGTPVVLVHGFGANRVQNWRAPGWYDTLVAGGYSVVAMDCRGHGESDKPHDVASYDESTMARDVSLVISSASSVQPAIMGYSMGGAIALRLAQASGDLFSHLVLGGVGETYFERTQEWRDWIAEGLTAKDVVTLSATQLMFRDFASQPGKDVRALAACMRAPRDNLKYQQLQSIETPTLLVCGQADNVSGLPGPLAAVLGNARAITIPKRDHMLTVGDRLYKEAVIQFLGNS